MQLSCKIGFFQFVRLDSSTWAVRSHRDDSIEKLCRWAHIQEIYSEHPEFGYERLLSGREFILCIAALATSVDYNHFDAGIDAIPEPYEQGLLDRLNRRDESPAARGSL